jgi:hypothetical protein
MSTYFFLVFVLTVFATRVFLFIRPTAAPTIGKLRLHHYMYGIAGIIIGFIFHSIILFAIGTGLFIDELTYLLIHGKTHKDNYSKISLAGTLFFVLLVFFLRNYLILSFGK